MTSLILFYNELIYTFCIWRGFLKALSLRNLDRKAHVELSLTHTSPRVSCGPGWPQTPFAAEDLELLILPPQTPVC